MLFNYFLMNFAKKLIIIVVIIENNFLLKIVGHKQMY
jgi:hypothetical protein